jgi:uncharacterized cysteine cluster protein YcgN (CxxCxxCC family)
MKYLFILFIFISNVCFSQITKQDTSSIKSMSIHRVTTNVFCMPISDQRKHYALNFDCIKTTEDLIEILKFIPIGFNLTDEELDKKYSELKPYLKNVKQ